MPIFEPAAGIAAGRCLAARTLATLRPRALPVTTQHPRVCGWCDWPLEALRREVAGFLEWSGYSERMNTYAHHELRVWSELPRPEQERQVVAAQAFEPLEAMSNVGAAPADIEGDAIEVVPDPPAHEEDVVAWMP